jgi:sarcosine oxidase
LGPIIYTKTCLYTLTPDRDFVIDTLPEHPGVAVAIGGGHGFKFASLIGRILSELALDGRTERDLEPFRIDRPILAPRSAKHGLLG